MAGVGAKKVKVSDSEATTFPAVESDSFPNAKETPLIASGTDEQRINQWFVRGHVFRTFT
jgi:hypothetical protein